MSKKSSPIFQEKIEGWHPQLPPRVSPTLVTPQYTHHVAEVLQLSFSDSGYQFSVCVNLVQNRFVSSVIFPADSQHVRLQYVIYIILSTCLCKGPWFAAIQCNCPHDVFDSLIWLSRVWSFHAVVSDHNADLSAPIVLDVLVLRLTCFKIPSHSPPTISSH